MQLHTAVGSCSPMPASGVRVTGVSVTVAVAAIVAVAWGTAVGAGPKRPPPAIYATNQIKSPVMQAKTKIGIKQPMSRRFLSDLVFRGFSARNVGRFWRFFPAGAGATSWPAFAGVTGSAVAGCVGDVRGGRTNSGRFASVCFL